MEITCRSLDAILTQRAILAVADTHTAPLARERRLDLELERQPEMLTVIALSTVL